MNDIEYDLANANEVEAEIIEETQLIETSGTNTAIVQNENMTATNV
jgi:hypothetical protein